MDLGPVMFMDAPDSLLYVVIGAFVLGWVVAKLGGAVAGKVHTRKRDPRDDRIRNLDAELRIAQSEGAKARDELSREKGLLNEVEHSVEDRDSVISSLNAKIEQLRADLKDSVMKTRELRSELSNRAEENVRSEVKLREVETELSVAQASTDLIATGVLDYSVAPDGEEEVDDESPSQAKAAR